MGEVRKPPQLKLDLGEISHQNMKQMQILNEATFPITYHEQFYKSIMDDTKFTRLGFYADILTSAICCRVDPREDCPPGARRTKRLYILTLSVLPAYRRRGFGTELLDFAMKTLNEQPNKDEFYDIYLHVHVTNPDAIAFYERSGFVQKEEVKNYYKHLDPPDCYVYSKKLGGEGSEK